MAIVDVRVREVPFVVRMDRHPASCRCGHHFAWVAVCEWEKVEGQFEFMVGCCECQPVSGIAHAEALRHLNDRYGQGLVVELA